MLHSSAYREPTSFADKRVVVLGLGSTALDVALDLVDVADKVRHSCVVVFSAPPPPQRARARAGFFIGSFQRVFRALHDGIRLSD